ncbi:MAG: acyl-CoA dehydratase activase [bacterium]
MLRFQKDGLVLGIDIGSVSISYVVIDPKKQIVQSDYVFHRGNVLTALKELLAGIDLRHISQVAYNHKASDFFATGESVNEQVALIEGVCFQKKDVGSAFVIGGESFGLFLFNEKNQYQKYISNSSCAAGTGAFLDQQAERLGLANSSVLSQYAEAYAGEPPKIATRCAVFAKTDLVHCQQQGFSIEAICAGLCKGLAHNIADTLVKGVRLQIPVVVVGGVSKNRKVMHYLSEIIGCEIEIPDKAVLTGALGCALFALNHRDAQIQTTPFTTESLLNQQTQKKQYFFQPLSTRMSKMPDFHDHPYFVSENVEIDLYHLPASHSKTPVYLGIDIGSTSTKAVVMEAFSDTQNILIGLYTRTLGQPIQATQRLLKALKSLEKPHKVRFEVVGTGTTGSGRKFVQKVLKTDLAVDEITAHARAAYALNPEIDTIIEIGGQDSKFTVMHHGQVTFSVMNYVCAAGTGSFIEEQAKRLQVPLDEYARRAMNAPSPLTSDRCTVFMERDLNHYLTQDYSKNELLAAALHSVRDNYLSKVAHLNKIGQVICFQGATAKNHALVSAFEQKLKRPIFVSKYCHLTGALGVCLILHEKGISRSSFRGIDFYKSTPRVTEEICDGCKNVCKLKRIEIAGETTTWGFLCGRDEFDNKPRSLNKSGFDLLSNRRKIFNPAKRPVSHLAAESDKKPKSLFSELRDFELDISLEKLKQNLELNFLNLRHKIFSFNQEELQGINTKKPFTIAIPNTLYLHEYLPFWKIFFRKLGYKVVTSAAKSGLLEKGKEISGAEFCAPISYWHGHVHSLIERADYVFLPQMFDDGEGAEAKSYCYYSTYAVALVQNIPSLNLQKRSLTPIIDFSKPALQNVQQIYESLPDELKFLQTPTDLLEAFKQARHWFSAQKKQLVEIFLQQKKLAKAISVVFLGRPYLAMDSGMNQRIPNKFHELGILTFFQDMLPTIEIAKNSPAQKFLKWNHWKFGEQILQAAEYVGQTEGLYPVYLTAFKCSPDSFLLTYFKEIMDGHQKPYLILQLDEHGSDVGYGTRVEAAVEAFRNHQTNRRRSKTCEAVTTSLLTEPSKKSHILIPNYDALSCSLICAAFERAGYQPLLIEETPTTVLSSLRLNDGQCLPLSSIVQGAVETIHKHNLHPEETALFLATLTRLACNLPQYPLMAKKMLEQTGAGFEKVQVIAADFDLSDFPVEVIYDVYCSYLLGGLIRRIGCKIRLHELVTGQTNQVIEEARERLYSCIANGESKESVFKNIVSQFQQIPAANSYESRPKVGIIGDLYVRDNDVFNQKLIYELENFGAEVVTVPYNFILRMLAIKHTHSLWQDGRYLLLLRDKLLLEVFEKFEKRLFQIANVILRESFPKYDDSLFDCLKKHGLSIKHGGETAQNLIKIYSMLEHYPDLKLFIHVNPIFCCPGLVSESLFKAVESEIGIPIVSLVYDGTSANRNEVLAPYLHFISQALTLPEDVPGGV